MPVRSTVRSTIRPTLRTIGNSSPIGSGGGVWLLEGGTWNDEGVWLDSATWLDSGGGAGGGGGGDPLLLDTYTGAAVAYSLRKLRTNYAGSCIRVRRSSDSAEQDIGFAAGVLDTASLLTFCGAGDGFVVTWYDQSGNNNHATQSTTTLQPQIVASGAVLELNGKPRLAFVADCLDFTAINGPDFSLFTVLQVNAVSNFSAYLHNVGAANGFKVVSFFTSTWSSQFIPFASTAEQMTNSRRRSTTRTLPTGQYIESWRFAAAPAVLQENGSAATLSSSVASGWIGSTARIGSLGYTGIAAGNVDLQESIIFNSDKASDQAAITAAINSHYGAYS